MVETNYAVHKGWFETKKKLKQIFGSHLKFDINAILMLIGIQESGVVKEHYTKEEKQDLMHVAICTLLESDGYFIKTTTDSDGWPHWEKLKALPYEGLAEQETFLKTKIIQYFENY